MKQLRHMMGMPITIEVVDSRAERAIDAAFAYLQWVDETFSTYKAGSQISRLNAGALALEQADPRVNDVLAECDRLRDQTDGYFDIRRADGIDPSGYVKGWAIRGAGDGLRQAGFSNWCVEAGGDLAVSGHNEDGEPWRVGIRDPRQAGAIVKVLHLTTGAAATSGLYERGEHIYNPHTGRPATELASVTVVGPDIVTADVYATAAFAMGAQAAGWIARQGLDCYVIDRSGEASYTPGLKRYL
jgi:thiamine biosynthesis lipoprotein